MRGSAAIVEDFGQNYSEGIAPDRLEQHYRVESYRVIRELYRLLPAYRSHVAKEAYRRDRARLMLVRAYLCSGPMDAKSLKTLLNYLLRQQQVVATTLNADFHKDA